MKRIALCSWMIISFLTFANEAIACSICFYGDPTEKMNVALRWGIVALLGALVVLMVLFIKFFISVSKRSKEALK